MNTPSNQLPPSSTGSGPDTLIKNPLDRETPAREDKRARRPAEEPHDPGPGLITNPLDKPGAADNLIENPIDKP